MLPELWLHAIICPLSAPSTARAEEYLTILRNIIRTDDVFCRFLWSSKNNFAASLYPYHDLHLGNPSDHLPRSSGAVALHLNTRGAETDLWISLTILQRFTLRVSDIVVFATESSSSHFASQSDLFDSLFDFESDPDGIGEILPDHRNSLRTFLHQGELYRIPSLGDNTPHNLQRSCLMVQSLPTLSTLRCLPATAAFLEKVKAVRQQVPCHNAHNFVARLPPSVIAIIQQEPHLVVDALLFLYHVMSSTVKTHTKETKIVHRVIQDSSRAFSAASGQHTVRIHCCVSRYAFALSSLISFDRHTAIRSLPINITPEQNIGMKIVIGIELMRHHDYKGCRRVLTQRVNDTATKVSLRSCPDSYCGDSDSWIGEYINEARQELNETDWNHGFKQFDELMMADGDQHFNSSSPSNSSSSRSSDDDSDDSIREEETQFLEEILSSVALNDQEVGELSKNPMFLSHLTQTRET